MQKYNKIFEFFSHLSFIFSNFVALHNIRTATNGHISHIYKELIKQKSQIMRLRFFTIAATLLTTLSQQIFAQESEEVATTQTELTPRMEKTIARQQHRDSVRANKKVWTSILGGPSYTPEASLGVAGAVLMSFKINEADTVSQRSYLPAGFNISLNGTFVVAGYGALFFNEEKFKIYSSYSFRNEPANFYGVGFDEIDSVERGDETTLYNKRSLIFFNRYVWEVKDNLFVGPVSDINFSYSYDLNEVMAENSYVNKYRTRYTNIGLGAIVQYDTRDDVATPHSGVLLSAMSRFYSRAFGGSYNYQFYDIEYRQFTPLFKRAILGWTLRTQFTYGDVPFTELPMFGSPFDLRGYYWGKYRDKSMGYGIVEYRQMFGSEEAYKRGDRISKFGYVAWVGAGTLGTTMADWNEVKINYGIGLRAQLQPRKNFRFDVGKGQGNDGWLFYMNMTEAF